MSSANSIPPEGPVVSESIDSPPPHAPRVPRAKPPNKPHNDSVLCLLWEMLLWLFKVHTETRDAVGLVECVQIMLLSIGSSVLLHHYMLVKLSMQFVWLHDNAVFSFVKHTIATSAPAFIKGLNQTSWALVCGVVFGLFLIWYMGLKNRTYPRILASLLVAVVFLVALNLQNVNISNVEYLQNSKKDTLTGFFSRWGIFGGYDWMAGTHDGFHVDMMDPRVIKYRNLTLWQKALQPQWKLVQAVLYFIVLPPKYNPILQELNNVTKKPEVKPEVKPVVKPVVKHEEKPVVKHEVKLVVKAIEMPVVKAIETPVEAVSSYWSYFDVFSQAPAPPNASVVVKEVEKPVETPSSYWSYFDVFSQAPAPPNASVVVKEVEKPVEKPVEAASSYWSYLGFSGSVANATQ